jgi:hypothetical protein
MTQLPPGIFSEGGGNEWSFRDHEGSEFGPYDSPEKAQQAFDRSEDDRLGRRHRASPALETMLMEFFRLESDINDLQDRLSELKAHRKFIAENEIVETATHDEAADGVRLQNGTEWTFEQMYHCSIRTEDKPAAFQYLTDQQQDGMLRRTITLSFGKDSAQRAADLKKLIKQMMPEYEVSLRVGSAPEKIIDALREVLKAANLDSVISMEQGYELPGATMRSWVVKNLKQGKVLPDVFTVYAPLQPKMVLLAPVLPEATLDTQTS